MPKATIADWPFIQALVLQGLQPKEIERRTGVKASIISVRANRRGWIKQRQQVTEELKASVTVKSPLLTDVVARASIDARQAVAKHLSATVALLPSPKSWKEGAKQQEALESTVRNAERVFGWSESTSQSMINSRTVSSIELPDNDKVGNGLATDAQVIAAQCQETGMQPVQLLDRPADGK